MVFNSEAGLRQLGTWFLGLLGKASRCSSVASYSGVDIGIPGIRSNKENLTFLWSSLMVEDG
ncbi:unnamed protein product [Brassica rapa subsp. trilocularis]